MFTGFTEETLQFFLDLKFHNSTEYFHREHARYLREVQAPFYELIEELSPLMRQVDPLMEIKPYKCLSRIHRDTRFTRDKSPYRDHLWFLFRRAAEPREKSLFYFFEFGPERLDWGMGFWGENRPVMDIFRRRIVSNPEGTAGLLDDLHLEQHHLMLGGTTYKRILIPPQLLPGLERWYRIKEFYIGKVRPEYRKAFSEDLVKEICSDFVTLAPLYQLFRGMVDQVPAE